MLSKQHTHDDVIKWKHFSHYWSFVRGIHRSPVNSPHKDQWRRTLMFSLTCAWMDNWVKNGEAGDLRRHRAQYDVTVMNIFQRIRTGLCPGYIISLVVLGWSYNCPCANKVTLNDLGKIGRYPTKTKRNILFLYVLYTNIYCYAFRINGPLWWESNNGFTSQATSNVELFYFLCW